MKHSDLWNLTGAALAAISRHYDPVAEWLRAESVLDVRTWGLLMAALTCEPATTTLARISVRGAEE